MQEFQKATMRNYMDMRMFYEDIEKSRKQMKKETQINNN
jgi:hypothetical protein